MESLDQAEDVREGLRELIQNENYEVLFETLRGFGQARGSRDYLGYLKECKVRQGDKYPCLKDVYGLGGVKAKLKEAFLLPLKYARLLRDSPIKLTRAVLLRGGSGSGKTFLARALINELQINAVEVKGPELLNKYIGASEQAVRDIFDRALAMAPCVVFFDEFESIALTRNAGSTSATDRVINQLLCYLDGTGSIEGVFIIAASSRPELIDPALLRSGRIDKHFDLLDPEPPERLEMIRGYGEGLALQDLSEEQMVADTQHYSYSEIAALFKEARIALANSSLTLNREAWQHLALPKAKPVLPAPKMGTRMIQM